MTNGILAKDIKEGMDTIYGIIVDVVSIREDEVVCNIAADSANLDDYDQFLFEPDDFIEF